MITPVAPLTERPAWKALTSHHKTIRELHLRKLFADDPTRGERMTAEAVGLYLDYSKNRVTATRRSRSPDPCTDRCPDTRSPDP